MAWLRLLTDQNFNNHIIVALRRRRPAIDVIRVHDIGLGSADDPALLEWAAQDERILISHDQATMADFGWERINAGLPMPGLIIVPLFAEVARVVDDLILIDECTRPAEWDCQVTRLPF
jgi:predicted nuclease of predicted toxin-antitoxin system